MKIGLSVTSCYNINGQTKNIDGIGVYTLELCKALATQHVQIEEIYFRHLSETFLSEIIHRKNFSVMQNPLYSLIPGNAKTIDCNKFDLLHITDHFVPRVKGIPVLATIHDSILFTEPQWRTDSRYQHWIKSSLLKKMVSHADGIITPSSANVRDIVSFWKIPEEKISVVHSGISEIWRQRLDELTRENVLKKYQLSKPFFLIAGTLSPRKNIETTLQAFLALPKQIADHVNLVIVGREWPTLTPASLVRQIRKMADTGRVFWLQYVPFTDLLALYQSAQILLYPSLAEGFGLPILEGFASGTPVITSHIGAMAEVAGNAAYLIDPYSQEELSTAMVTLVEKPALREQLIQQGLARSELFSWKQCAQETLKVYQQFV